MIVLNGILTANSTIDIKYLVDILCHSTNFHRRAQRNVFNFFFFYAIRHSLCCYLFSPSRRRFCLWKATRCLLFLEMHWIYCAWNDWRIKSNGNIYESVLVATHHIMLSYWWWRFDCDLSNFETIFSDANHFQMKKKKITIVASAQVLPQSMDTKNFKK